MMQMKKYQDIIRIHSVLKTSVQLLLKLIVDVLFLLMLIPTTKHTYILSSQFTGYNIESSIQKPEDILSR
jgi:hypothetical protein